MVGSKITRQTDGRIEDMNLKLSMNQSSIFLSFSSPFLSMYLSTATSTEKVM